MQIKVKKLKPEATLPIKATEHSNGYDLTVIGTDFDGLNHVIHTGIAVEIPIGYVGLIFPRSSISKKHAMLSNSVGVIDSDYRGEVIAKFRSYNYAENQTVEFSGKSPYTVGERCCQLLIVKAEIVDFTEASELSETARGDGGFGSTGV